MDNVNENSKVILKEEMGERVKILLVKIKIERILDLLFFKKVSEEIRLLKVVRLVVVFKVVDDDDDYGNWLIYILLKFKCFI